MKEKENWNEKEWEGVKGGGDNGSKSGALQAAPQTRARNKEEFIEERINAARGFLSPKALLRPEGCRTDLEERG